MRFRDLHPAIRLLLRWTLRLSTAFFVAAIIVFIIIFHTAIYHRFYRFPKEARAWEAIRAQRVPLVRDDGFNEYRGVCHSHSERSHDSDIPFPAIAAAANVADIDFICLSDHCVEGKADYSQGWKGLHNGVLFVRGYEMGDGFMPWGLPDNVVLNCGDHPDAIAKTIADYGGVLFFAHSEEDRIWDLPQLTGMEIYNIHTDFKDESYIAMLPDILLCIGRYPDQTIRLLFDRQTNILEHWDELSQARKIVGIAAVDAHQNNGFRGIYTTDGMLRLEETSGKNGAIYKIGRLSRLALRMLFGPLEPGKRLFQVQIDPYERSLRFVNTHILAKDLTEPALIDSLRQGRVFIAFDMIADARGFSFYARDEATTAVMGESVPLSESLSFTARSPVPCRFTLVKDGKQVIQATGAQFSYPVTDSGKYRIEAELDILGEWTPWVYTNSLEITAHP